MKLVQDFQKKALEETKDENFFINLPLIITKYLFQKIII